MVSSKIGVGVKEGVGVTVGDGGGVEVAPCDDVGDVVADDRGVADSWAGESLGSGVLKLSAATSVWRCGASDVLIGGPSNDPVAGVARVADANAGGSLLPTIPGSGEPGARSAKAVAAELFSCNDTAPAAWFPMGTPATKKPKDSSNNAKAMAVKVRTRRSRRVLLKPDRRRN